jgi:hypothetical protein
MYKEKYLKYPIVYTKETFCEKEILLTENNTYACKWLKNHCISFSSIILTKSGTLYFKLKGWRIKRYIPRWIHNFSDADCSTQLNFLFFGLFSVILARGTQMFVFWRFLFPLSVFDLLEPLGIWTYKSKYAIRELTRPQGAERIEGNYGVGNSLQR